MFAKHLRLIAFSFFALVTIGFSGCTKDDENPKPDYTSRDVKFELLGTYTGTVKVTYTAISGGTTTELVTIPWSKTLGYATTVSGCTFSGVSQDLSKLGVAGQQVNFKIYSANTVAVAKVYVADSSGVINILPASITF